MQGEMTLAALGACVLIAVAGTPVGAQPTERVSVSSAGVPGNADSGEIAGWTQPTIVSGNGRWVIFGSLASNLVPNDTNDRNDVFLRDRLNGVTTRVSLDSTGAQLEQASYLVGASATAKAILFATRAPAVPTLDGNGEYDLYVRKVVRDRTELASARSTGRAAGAYWGAISLTGSQIAFASIADRVVIPWDENGFTDVFVRDLNAGTTRLCSVDSAGNLGNGHSGADPTGQAIGVAISLTGEWVAFGSLATNLVPSDTNGQADVFVHQLTSGKTLRVSEAEGGGEANGPSFVSPYCFSRDARFILFQSLADNLVEGDTGAADLFVRQVLGGPLDRVSIPSSGGQANGDSYPGSISFDGEEVTFISRASNLVPGDTNGRADLFSHRRVFNRTDRLNVSFTGDETEARRSPGYDALLSFGGRYVGFTSRAPDLVRGDGNELADVFIRDRIQVQLQGTPRFPSRVRFELRHAIDEEGAWVLVLLSASGSNGIFLPNGSVIPLTFDGWTAAGLQAFPILSGIVTSGGVARTPELTFPVIQPGITVYSAAITLEPHSGRLMSITGPTHFTTQ